MDILRRLKQHWKLLASVSGLFLFGFLMLRLALIGSLPLPGVSITTRESGDEKAPLISLDEEGLKIGANTIRISRHRLDMGGKKIVNLADPTDAQDAATKKYVDEHAVRKIEARRKDTGEWEEVGVLDHAECQDSENCVVWDKEGNKWTIDQRGLVNKNDTVYVTNPLVINYPKVSGRYLSTSYEERQRYCQYCKNLDFAKAESWQSPGITVVCTRVRSNCTCQFINYMGSYTKKIWCGHVYDDLRW